MLADAIIEPLSGEDGALEDVDPEEGHEDTYPLSRWVTLNEITSGKATKKYLNPSNESSLKYRIIFSLALRLYAQHYFDNINKITVPDFRSRPNRIV